MYLCRRIAPGEKFTYWYSSPIPPFGSGDLTVDSNCKKTQFSHTRTGQMSMREFRCLGSSSQRAKLRNPWPGYRIVCRNVALRTVISMIAIALDRIALSIRKPKHRLEISSMARHHYPPITPITAWIRDTNARFAAKRSNHCKHIKGKTAHRSRSAALRHRPRDSGPWQNRAISTRDDEWDEWGLNSDRVK